MSKVVRIIVGAALVVAGVVTGNFQLIMAGVSMVGSALMQPKSGNKKRAASSTAVQIGEVYREAMIGTGLTGGSLVDAFNYGGKYGTDWEVLVIALADHRCAALEGYYVNDTYVAFGGDGNVAGYNNQLQVYWRPGTETQAVPSILTTYGPGWTPNDNGAGVCYVVVAYKADAADAKNPVWPGGRPRFAWVLKGAYCYDARKDSSVGGSGAHRIANPATWEYSDNPIVTRYKFQRGFYACDRVGQPDQLLVGRGLSDIEAPPANVFARANLCDELVGGEKRYRVGGSISAGETFLSVEEDFATACAGTIVQPQGCVEIDPGEARAVVAFFTDDDLVVGSRVRWNNGHLSTSSDEWVNTVVASYIEPTQKWAEHAAPVQRDVADVTADRQPREQRILLGFVTWVNQAQRVGQIVRRLGRLHGRAEVTLPPRFCEIEEGDWVQWQSARRFNGATLTFRVEAWGSNEKWHHTLQLRQISASVYSDTAPLDDGSIAAPSPVPPAIGAPLRSAWALTSDYLEAGGIRTPVLLVAGSPDDRTARFVRIEYAAQLSTPGPSTKWVDAGVTGPDVERREIAVAAGGSYYVAISYVVDNVSGDRLILGPVNAGPATYPDGTPIEDVQPLEPGATAVATVRHPVLPPVQPADGSLYFDIVNDQYRFEGLDLAFNEAPILFNGAPLVGPGYVYVVPDALANNGYVVEIVPPLPQTVFTDYAGAPLSSQFPRTLTPTVKQGGTDIRIANHVQYSIVATGVTATMNNIPGHADKGRITVTGGRVGHIMLSVQVDTTTYGPYKIQFTESGAGAPNLGGSGAKSASVSTFPNVISAVPSTIAGPFTLTVASGEDILCAFPANYAIVDTGFATAALLGKWQSSPAGAGTWADAGAAIGGGEATWDPEVHSGDLASGLFNQTISGLAPGDYDVRFVAGLSITLGTPSLEIFSSTATAIVQ